MNKGRTIQKVCSGGQTGVDRAALDAALEVGVSAGGWCPRGRRAEDGEIAVEYPFVETPSDDYRQRTEWNVRDTDATLILYRLSLTGGTALTRKFAESLGKPCLAVELGQDDAAAVIDDWIAEHQIAVLNVAGPRESGCPGIRQEAYDLLAPLLDQHQSGYK